MAIRVAELQLLESFRLLMPLGAVELPFAEQRLLAFLALQNRPVLRARAARKLWFGDGPDRCLRSALWRLSRSGARIVESTRFELRLSDRVSIDVRNQVGTAERILQGSSTDGPMDDWKILALELLPDWQDDWVDDERRRLRQLRLHALERVAVELKKSGRFGEAIEAAGAAVRADPLRESSRRCLIAGFLAEGNQVEALREANVYRDLLRREVGTEPTAEFLALLPSNLIPWHAPPLTH